MKIKDKRISIIGFGSQGKSWAQNLTDSGFNVKVALRAGSYSIGKASELGFDVTNLRTAFVNSDIICMLTPDETHAEIIGKYAQEMDRGQSIVFAHGFNIHYGTVKIHENANVILVSPKGTGKALRELFLKGSGVPSMIAVERDVTNESWDIANDIAVSLGSGKMDIMKSTFREETEINLFSEQAFFLSALPEIIRETYQILCEAGYSPKASYYETLHKLGIMSELLQKNGLYEYYEKVSSVARLGGMLSKGRIITDSSIKEMKKILKEIQDRTFLKRLNEEIGSKNKNYKNYLSEIMESDLEKTGKLIREKAFRNEY